MSSRSRSRVSGILLGLLLPLLGSLSGTSHAQSGTAPNGDPGGFGIDGNLGSNTPVAGATDWVAGSPGSGLALMFDNGAPKSSSTLHGIDGFDLNDRIFISNSRLFNDPSTGWTWADVTMMTALGGKEDFAHGLAHFSSADGHTWLTWSLDRRGSGGESYFDIGLYQNSLIRNANGTFSSGGPHAGHTVGDLVLSLHLLNAGPQMLAWRWTEISPGVYDFTSLSLSGVPLYVALNADAANVPYPAFGNDHYGPDHFVEAAIDLDALVGQSTTFSTVFFDSRFGSGIGSVLKDFIDPIATSIVVGVDPIPSPNETRIVAVAPNPARGPVGVTFEVGREGPVTLEVFDVAGRRAGSPVHASFPAGRHTLRWDPPPAEPAVRGGVLYARIVQNARSDVRRFVWLPGSK